MNKTIVILAAVLLTVGCKNQIDHERVSIIPIPVEINAGKGEFKINPNTTIVYSNDSLSWLATYASSLWEQYLGYPLQQSIELEKHTSNHIGIKINSYPNEIIDNEGYTIEINRNGVLINANTKAGILYGIQTFYQLLSTNPKGIIPCLSITDYPRFAYRGMHLDVSRHFHPVDFIYQMLDHMAMHKLNTFHWHLVDDQGWRLEIKKYPKLTEVGAWRVDMSERHWDDRPVSEAKSGTATYGGFYTQDEVRAVVAYAAERNITVMPEIEMPAHVMSALAAYPDYSCTGENLGVPPGGVWPITHIYCAGNDDTFKFLEDILIEVMDLFPSKYIHIGGDEADKTEWKRCKKCQQRIKDEGLTGEDELQSYFIKRIEKFLNDHNRKIVGWDEILEGGLAPNAVVMSWRGDEGGIEATRIGNKAIMTPGSHCYFNFYQGDPALEPLAFGGNTTLKKVYGYEPLPAELSKEESKLIIGAQANLWSEFLPTTQLVEYMAFPRLAALAEVLWSPKESRNWTCFTHRMKHQYNRYKKLGINYSLSAFQVNTTNILDTLNQTIKVKLTADIEDPQIRYTLDGTDPNRQSKTFNKPIVINKSTTLKSAVFENGEMPGKIRTNHFNLHKAFAKNIELEYTNSPRYDGSGKHTLVNGITGSNSYSDGNWQGFLGRDMVATIDLGIPQSIESIMVDALQDITSWIFLPQSATFEVSTDGESFSVLETVKLDAPSPPGEKLVKTFSTSNDVDNIQFVRVTLQNLGVCPKGQSGEGNPAWLFVSEIIVM